MDRFSFSGDPASVNVVYEAGDLRISVLTARLLRVEKGAFTDLPTQTVWNRNLGEIPSELTRSADSITLRTEGASFQINVSTGAVQAVTLADGRVVTDFRHGNLLGTARTLDTADGAVKLDNGIMSRTGVGVMDDSESLLLTLDGRILPRPACSDCYYFAYGHDYLGQLRDFYRLTGPVPLIPKFALGNWWSRYKAYTQEEYRQLMQRFIDRKLPVTVATIDMDWHWTDVVDRFGEAAKAGSPRCEEEVIYNTILHGWTGYSWNTELFPNHRELLDWLHGQNFHVTLNVHPSQGIRFFEDCYGAVCARLGRNPAEKKPVFFEITDPAFVQAYFDEVHHPLEAEGVDFWWLDWQQGKLTDIPGLDPLWALNHYHTLDAARGEQRPLILSRYAGLGSHRYPLGFSGDTICTWKSLAFQPYFTNTAANAGYSWWSHDIGGHMKGIQDDELYLRWLQYGVFSPVNRLHSSSSDYMGKEPWKRSWAVEKIAERFLRLRHKMIPFLYTANYRTHTDGVPICMPMYYRFDCEEAYQTPNQYLFGDRLLVCPVTEPMDRRLNLAATKVWLPEGRWTDIFNGRIYRGGKWVTMYRDLDSIPVLAPAGAIVPMYRSDESNDLSLAQPLEIHVWHGDGDYTLYEDDGETRAFERGCFVLTQFKMETDGNHLRFTVTPPADAHGLLPRSRQMEICFRDIVSARVLVNGEEVRWNGGCVVLDICDRPVAVELLEIRAAENEPYEESRINLLTRVQCSNQEKSSWQRDGRDCIPAFVRDALAELEAMRERE